MQAPLTRASSHAREKKDTSSFVPSISHDGISIHSEESTILWKYVVNRTTFVEKELSDRAQEGMKIMEPILKSDLVKTILNLSPYYPKLVKKFIVNLSPSFNNVNSPQFCRVHV